MPKSRNFSSKVASSGNAKRAIQDGGDEQITRQRGSGLRCVPSRGKGAAAPIAGAQSQEHDAQHHPRECDARTDNRDSQTDRDHFHCQRGKAFNEGNDPGRRNPDVVIQTLSRGGRR